MEEIRVYHRVDKSGQWAKRAQSVMLRRRTVVREGRLQAAVLRIQVEFTGPTSPERLPAGTTCLLGLTGLVGV